MIQIPVQGAEHLSRVERRKAETNKRLLKVARQLFFEKGIYWAKVEDITELADLGKGTFYKYFDSKETIIRVLLEQGLKELLEDTKQAVAEAPSESKILSNVIEARVKFFLKYPDYLLLFHQIRGLMQIQVDAAQELRAIYDGHVKRLAQLVRPVIENAGKTNAKDLAVAIAAYTSGLLTYHVLFDGVEGVRRRQDGIVESIEASIKALLKSGNGGS
ncbi:TetR/AcrR family transcriptional regulator [Petrachloros mirabilis]